MKEQAEKSVEEKTRISVKVVNFLSKKDCTIDEAFEILKSAGRIIKRTSKVQKFKWSAD